MAGPLDPHKKTRRKQGSGAIKTTSRRPVNVLGFLMIEAEDIIGSLSKCLVSPFSTISSSIISVF